MKQEKNIQTKLNNFYDSSRSFLERYIDTIIGSFVSFLILLPFYYFILLGFFKLRFIFAFPILIIVSLAISPFLSKIKVGGKIVKSYDRLLNKNENEDEGERENRQN